MGCGPIGRKRAIVATKLGSEVTLVADINEEMASRLATDVGANATSDWRRVVDDPTIDVIVVATPTNLTVEIGVNAMGAGKHALCEKPLGRTAAEAATLVESAESAGVILKTGFNHRHHPAISMAHQICETGDIGDLLGIRASYGHGGRPGYETEWRAKPEIAGGGELLDQGVHVIDLSRWFLGQFSEVTGVTATWFWQIAPLEDNCFALLRTRSGQIASIHCSWTQWKNLFRFEIFGRDGAILIDGLGGSYGRETLPSTPEPTPRQYLINGAGSLRDRHILGP